MSRNTCLCYNTTLFTLKKKLFLEQQFENGTYTAIKSSDIPLYCHINTVVNANIIIIYCI